MDKAGRTASFTAYDEATLAALAPMAQHRMVEQRVPSRVQARDEPCADPTTCDVHAERQLPAAPPWVADPEKWQSLSRRERRALERHHRKVAGR